MNIIGVKDWYAQTHPAVCVLLMGDEGANVAGKCVLTDSITESQITLNEAATYATVNAIAGLSNALNTAAPSKPLNNISADEHFVFIGVADKFGDNVTDRGRMQLLNNEKNNCGVEITVTSTKVRDIAGTTADFTATLFSASAVAACFTIDRNTNITRQLQKAGVTSELATDATELGAIELDTSTAGTVWFGQDATDKIIFYGMVVVKWKGPNGPDSFTAVQRLAWVDNVYTNFRAGNYIMPTDLRNPEAP